MTNEILTASQRRFYFWVRSIAVSSICLILGGLSYMAFTFEGLDVSTPIICYVGKQIVWEGIARGTVMPPARNYPWRFTDAVTGEPVVIGAYCEKGQSIYAPKEDD